MVATVRAMVPGVVCVLAWTSALVCASSGSASNGGPVQTPAARADVTDIGGAWRLDFGRSAADATWQADCVIDQERAPETSPDRERDVVTLSGACTSGFDALATVHGRLTRAHVAFTLEPRRRQASPDDRPVRWTFDGEVTLEGARAVTMAGTWFVVDEQGERTSGTFSGRRR